MPIVKTVKGDLLNMFREDQFDEIVHGCNCFHNMGAGIAAQISREFPGALIADKEQSVYGSREKLGDFSVYETEFGFIVNMYTQFNLGKVRDKEFLYDAIRKGFTKLDGGEPNDGWTIGIPLIGAGIAGGNWEKIKKIINEVTPHVNVVVVEYQP